ncbi:hypothetical protein E3983_01355 [Legionella israelensis]|uniref:Putative auto-transporter adhesin head GIN domain-containing protein n=1 Tax=Legionella israelensis TaxID=454 RepID=A0AAX1EDE5_9GAMM|nr:hypothetical protein E3983_01355 [Legionella israelensis]
MLTRTISLISIFILLCSCAHRPAIFSPRIKKAVSKSVLTSKPVRAKQVKKVSGFNSVDVEGVIDVSLHSGYSKPQVILYGDPRDLKQVQVFVTNQRLYVKVGKGYPDCGRITAVIHGHRLYAFKYKGVGVVKGTKLNSSSLALDIDNDGSTILKGHLALTTLNISGKGSTQIHGISNRGLRINMKGKPRVQLTGQTSLTSLNLTGSGWLSLYWVNSPFLRVCAYGSAKAQLAGIVDELHVELWDSAKFKGRYLRANRTFVKTHQRSIAEISTLKKQHSLASDASDIYYYNIPTMQTNFMAFNGAVLDMREWPQHDLEEYDRYNKHIP